MRPLSAIRRARLNLLVEEWGSAQALADHIGKDRRQVSAWRADPKKKGAKGMRDETAREIERLCLKRSGWLDHESSEHDVNPASELLPSSRLARMDRVRLRDAMGLLAGLAELQGVPALAQDPEALSVAYDFLAEFDSPIKESNILDLTKRLAAKLRGNTDGGKGESKAG